MVSLKTHDLVKGVKDDDNRGYEVGASPSNLWS